MYKERQNLDLDDLKQAINAAKKMTPSARFLQAWHLGMGCPYANGKKRIDDSCPWEDLEYGSYSELIEVIKKIRSESEETLIEMIASHLMCSIHARQKELYSKIDQLRQDAINNGVIKK